MGQKPAPKKAKAVTLSIATLGIGYSALLAVQHVGFTSPMYVIFAALLVGSGITGIVALQESFEEDQAAAPGSH